VQWKVVAALHEKIALDEPHTDLADYVGYHELRDATVIAEAGDDVLRAAASSLAGDCKCHGIAWDPLLRPGKAKVESMALEARVIPKLLQRTDGIRGCSKKHGKANLRLKEPPTTEVNSSRAALQMVTMGVLSTETMLPGLQTMILEEPEAAILKWVLQVLHTSYIVLQAGEATAIRAVPSTARQIIRMSDFTTGAGTAGGIEIWRIENKVPKPWPVKDYGKFFEGDSYIVLSTKVKNASNLEWDIFFWLGNESSQDEQGIAAYKTVELDEMLGGAAVQHRETQGGESAFFMQFFRSVHYLTGGVASGFHKVERGIHETALLKLSGTRAVCVSHVPVSASSLDKGSVFVLVMSDTMIQWNGSQANKKRKKRGLM